MYKKMKIIASFLLIIPSVLYTAEAPGISELVEIGKNIQHAVDLLVRMKIAMARVELKDNIVVPEEVQRLLATKKHAWELFVVDGDLGKILNQLTCSDDDKAWLENHAGFLQARALNAQEEGRLQDLSRRSVVMRIFPQ